MTRTRYASLGGGGLNWDSLPLKLFAGGNAKFWDPADIDLSRDRADWEALSDRERDYPTRLATGSIDRQQQTPKLCVNMTQDIGDVARSRRRLIDAHGIRASRSVLSRTSYGIFRGFVYAD